MDIFFIVRKFMEVKRSYTQILNTALSLKQVRRTLADSGQRDRIYTPRTCKGQT